jgi:hypothetical protein
MREFPYPCPEVGLRHGPPRFTPFLRCDQLSGAAPGSLLVSGIFTHHSISTLASTPDSGSGPPRSPRHAANSSVPSGRGGFPEADPKDFYNHPDTQTVQARPTARWSMNVLGDIITIPFREVDIEALKRSTPAKDATTVALARGRARGDKKAG